MRWFSRYGKQYEWFLDLEAEGQEIEALDKLPSIQGLEFYWVAWTRLTTCRAFGMAAGPIPWTAIQEYADRHGVDAEQRYMLERVINGLESVQTDLSKESTTRMGNPGGVSSGQNGKRQGLGHGLAKPRRAAPSHGHHAR